MPDPCPHCGGQMADDTPEDRDEFWQVTWRCAKCGYWDETTIQPDGTIVTVGHAVEGGEG